MTCHQSDRFVPSLARRRWLRHAGGIATALFSLPAMQRPVQAGQDSVAAAELKHAAERAELCSAANATGTGLRGEYFSMDAKRPDPLLVRVDAVLDFDPGLEWPASLQGQRPGWARWTGWVKPPIGGRYRFHVDQPHSQVVVARQPMVGEDARPGAEIELAAGRFFPITVEIKRLEPLNGRLRLEWTAPYGARYLVPRALLFVPSETLPRLGREPAPAIGARS